MAKAVDPMRTTALIGVVAVALAGGGCGSSNAVHQNSARHAAPTRLPIQARIPIGETGVGLIAAQGAIWVVTMEKDSLLGIDPHTNRVMARLRLGPAPNDPVDLVPPAYGDGSVWVSQHQASQIVRVRLHPLRVASRIDVEGAWGVAYGFGAVWVAQFDAYKWARIDPARNKVVASFPAEGPSTTAVGDGSAWILAHRANTLLRVEPKSNHVLAAIPIKTGGGVPEQVLFAYGSLWVTDPLSPSVARIDAKTNKQLVEILFRKDMVGAVPETAGAGYLWVASDHHVIRIDPKTNAFASVLTVKPDQRRCGWQTRSGPGDCFDAVTYAYGSLWVVDVLHRQVLRLSPR
ncbi:MAG TPA: hypothetical protein VE596_02980 [Gaiellaceae bacterium]|nr:hypothetical protein [Gaiellaceae bacterium]